MLAGFVLAWIMVGLPFRQLLLKFLLYQAHKTIGLLVLLATILRLLLRARQGRPAWDAGLSPRDIRLARIGQALLYALLLVVPMLGWLTAETAALRLPTFFLGFITLPQLLPADPDLFALLRPLHRALAILLVILAIGHAGMAIRHHRAGRDVLRRMWRGG